MVKNLTLSINSAVSWILKVLMLSVSAYFFLGGNILFGGFSFLMLMVSLIPAIVNRSYDVNLPWSLDLLLTIWMALSIAGEVRFYEVIWWWDDFLHFGGTAVLVYLAFVLVYALNFTKKIKLSIPFIGFFTFLIGVAFGAVWEIAEFYVWKFTGSDALAMGNPPDFKAGLFDTFSDLRLDAIGSALIALVGMRYVASQRHIKLREWMHPFTKIFGKKIREVKEKTKEKIIEEKVKLSNKFHKSKKK
jgi:hypothetical protein